MQKTFAFGWMLMATLSISADGQSRSTRTSLKNVLDKALQTYSLTGPDSRPFHVRLVISEAENPQSPYQGSIEEWWSSPTQWRREVVGKGGLHQTIVVSGGKKSERDEGDYFPLWLRNFVTALFDPVPNSSAWTEDNAALEIIQQPNAFSSDTCERTKSKIGTGSRSTDAFSVICFDGEGRLSSLVSPRYSMSFNHYKKFGAKQIPFAMGDVPEPGTEIGGEVVKLEELSNSASNDLFTLQPSNDSRFDSSEMSAAQLEQLTASTPQIVWPAVKSGNLRGNLALYISIDAEGHVREAWPLNSDNAGLDDPTRDQVKKWTVVPVKDSGGNAIQADGPLGFRFDTRK